MQLQHVPEKDPLFYFNTVEDKLVVGQAAYEQQVEAGAHPLDVVPLRDALTQPVENVIPSEHPDRLDVDQWERQDYITYGKWLANEVCAQPDGTPHLDSKILRAGGILGVGPSVKRLEAPKRFGKLAGYYHELGLNHLKQKGLYSSWSERDFLSYLQKVSTDVDNRRPTIPILIQKSGEGQGPSPHTMMDATGLTMSQLNERIGFPDVESWAPEDYIDWGTRFMLANDGKKPTARAIDFLSQRDRGPSAKNVAIRFDSLIDFQDQVLQKYQEIRAEEEQRLKEQSATLEQDIIDGTIPSHLITDAGSTDLAIARSAKYTVARQLLGHAGESTCSRIARASNDRFISLIQRHNNLLTAGHIEMTADEMGYYENIWPIEYDIDSLRLSNYTNV